MTVTSTPVVLRRRELQRNNFKVVGIVAQARHGKDTIADCFLDHAGYKRISLADELKLEAARLMPFPEYQLSFDEQGRVTYEVPDDELDPELKARRRRFWQSYGTQGRRHIFEQYWIWQWQAKAIKAATEGWPGVVIADVRFPDEARYVSEHLGCQLVGALRTVGDAISIPYEEPGIDYTVESEKYIPHIHDALVENVIMNNTSYEDYLERVPVKLRQWGLI